LSNGPGRAWCSATRDSLRLRQTHSRVMKRLILDAHGRRPVRCAPSSEGIERLLGDLRAAAAEPAPRFEPYAPGNLGPRDSVSKADRARFPLGNLPSFRLSPPIRNLELCQERRPHRRGGARDARVRQAALPPWAFEPPRPPSSMTCSGAKGADLTRSASGHHRRQGDHLRRAPAGAGGRRPRLPPAGCSSTEEFGGRGVARPGRKAEGVPLAMPGGSAPGQGRISDFEYGADFGGAHRVVRIRVFAKVSWCATNPDGEPDVNRRAETGRLATLSTWLARAGDRKFLFRAAGAGHPPAQLDKFEGHQRDYDRKMRPRPLVGRGR